MLQPSEQEQVKPTTRRNSLAPGEIRLEKAALDDYEGNIVLRGILDARCLDSLKTDEYQRRPEDRPSIFKAVANGEQLPDIELGMRGQDFSSKGDEFILKSPVYIIDGLQRVHNALKYHDSNPDASIRIGTLIHFGTTREWEAKRFEILNGHRKRVGVDIRLRNARTQHRAVLTLWGLSHTTAEFPLVSRVCWDQRMERVHLVRAGTLAVTAANLHNHWVATPARSLDSLVRALDEVESIIGLNRFRTNIITFFQLIDECWGIRSIEYAKGAPQIKNSFLNALALLLASHAEFWKESDEKVLSIPAPLRSKLSKFAISDPEIARLASLGGNGFKILYQLLINHVNLGKRTKRLEPRERVGGTRSAALRKRAAGKRVTMQEPSS